MLSITLGKALFDHLKYPGSGLGVRLAKLSQFRLQNSTLYPGLLLWVFFGRLQIPDSLTGQGAEMSGLDCVWFTYGLRHDVGPDVADVRGDLRKVKGLGRAGLWAVVVGCDRVPMGWVAGGGI